VNDQFSSTLQLNLDYDDPPGAPDLADRARVKGRRLRRTRRVSALAGAALIATGGIAVAADPPWGTGGRGGVQVATSAWLPDLSGLEVSVGQGPGIDRFAVDGYRPGEVLPEAGREPHPPLGQVHTVATAADGAETVVFVSKNAFLCIGEVKPGSADVEPAVCRPLDDLPAEGFWGGATYSPDDTPPGVLSPAPAIVTGLVRGPVDRVVIYTPRGDVDATLARTSDPDLGTLYWAVTPVPMQSAQTSMIARIAYRGDTAVFACQGIGCLVHL